MFLVIAVCQHSHYTMFGEVLDGVTLQQTLKPELHQENNLRNKKFVLIK